MEDWRVSDVESLSDHRYITSKLESAWKEKEWKRNPRETAWDSLKEELQGQVVDFPKRYKMEDELELVAELAVQNAGEFSCDGFYAGIDKVPKPARLHRIVQRSCKGIKLSVILEKTNMVVFTE